MECPWVCEVRQLVCPRRCPRAFMGVDPHLLDPSLSLRLHERLFLRALLLVVLRTAPFTRPALAGAAAGAAKDSCCSISGAAVTNDDARSGGGAKFGSLDSGSIQRVLPPSLRALSVIETLERGGSPKSNRYPITHHPPIHLKRPSQGLHRGHQFRRTANRERTSTGRVHQGPSRKLLRPSTDSLSEHLEP